jgi:hypothetical protein
MYKRAFMNVRFDRRTGLPGRPFSAGSRGWSRLHSWSLSSWRCIYEHRSPSSCVRASFRPILSLRTGPRACPQTLPSPCATIPGASRRRRSGRGLQPAPSAPPCAAWVSSARLGPSLRTGPSRAGRDQPDERRCRSSAGLRPRCPRQGDHLVVPFKSWMIGPQS